MLRAAVLITAALAISGCTSSPPESSATPTTVADADFETNDGVLEVNVGMILNTSAPTAARDARLAQVMRTAADVSNSSVRVRIQTIEITSISDAPSAVRELVDRGVTVIATSCDDSSMPLVVEATIDEQLLAVTGCVTIPRPELQVQSRLFIDLAGLEDTSSAMAEWAVDSGVESMAIISSALIPDVSNTCSDLEVALNEREIRLAAKTTFTGLVDNPAEPVAAIGASLPDADAIAICALAPSLSDTVLALRSAGFDQPIIVPWFGDPQAWTPGVDDVFVLAPASRFDDDPVDSVRALFRTLGDHEAVDVVAADTISILANSAERAGSRGSTRIADTIRSTQTFDAVSGQVEIDADSSTTIGRDYRLIEIVDGVPTAAGIVRSDG